MAAGISGVCGPGGDQDAFNREELKVDRLQNDVVTGEPVMHRMRICKRRWFVRREKGCRENNKVDLPVKNSRAQR